MGEKGIVLLKSGTDWASSQLLLLSIGSFDWVCKLFEKCITAVGYRNLDSAKLNSINKFIETFTLGIL